MTPLAPLALLLSLGSSHALAQRVEIADRKGVQEMIVSVKDLSRAAALYQQVAGWKIVAQEAAPPPLAAFWQLPSTSHIEQIVLGNPSTTQGLLRLVRFRGMPQAQIRSSGRPFDTGGIFNLNMLVKDMDAAFESLRDHGSSRPRVGRGCSSFNRWKRDDEAEGGFLRHSRRRALRRHSWCGPSR